MTIRKLLALFPLVLLMTCSKDGSHIEKYGVRSDTLLSLPDGFYGHRRGNLYFHDVKPERYAVWATQDYSGNVVEKIFKVEDFENIGADTKMTIEKYKIDTAESKVLLQRFMDISAKLKFGHIYIERGNRISFSYRDGLREQYVLTFNDSIRQLYLADKDFILLENGWFEYIRD